MNTIRVISRRGFLGDVFATGALIVGASVVPEALSAGDTESRSTQAGSAWKPNVFVGINPDGSVILIAHRSEMGTGSRTSLPMVLADEMEADWKRVKIVQAPGDEPKYGNQDTDGSRSMRHHIQPMRQMGAAVRTMLEQAAAKLWGVDPTACRAEVHEVVMVERVGEGVSTAASNKRIGFGDLAKAAMALPVPGFEKLKFKDESHFRYIG